MNFRNTAFLFGLLLGMFWLFGLMLAYRKSPVDESLVLKTLGSDPNIVVNELILKKGAKGGPALTFVMTDTGWMQKAGSQVIRVDDNQVNKIITDCKRLSKIEESDVILDPEKNGLAEPKLTVTLKGNLSVPKLPEKEDDFGKEPEKAKGKEKEWTLKVGNTTASKDRVFVSSSDRPGRVLVVAKSSIESLEFKDENAFRAAQLFNFNELTVKKLLLKEGKTELELKKSDDDTWRFVMPPWGHADFEGQPEKQKEAPPQFPKKETPPPPTTGGVKNLIAKIRALRVESESDFIPATSEGKLSDYGLEPGKESMRIQVVGSDEKKGEALLIGNKVPEKDQYFAHMQDDMGIFIMTAKQLAGVREALQKPGELRSLSVTFADAKKIDMLKYTVRKEQVVLTHPEDKSWQLRLGDAKAESPANDQAVQDVIDAVETKRGIEKFYDADSDDKAKKLDAELGFDAAAAEMEIYVESQPRKEKDKDFHKKDDKAEEKKEEKKDTKPVTTLIFGKVDGDNQTVKRVQRDGTVARFAVAKSLADKLVPADLRLAFLDPVVPGGGTYAGVDGVILERGKEKLEFVRGTGSKAGLWLFKQDGSDFQRADATKLDAYIRGFTELRAAKWVKKIDDKTDLSAYGLNPPVLSITFVERKTTPFMAAGLTVSAGLHAFNMGGLHVAYGWIGTRQAVKTDNIVTKFGKESEQEKEKGASYALRSGTDLLFLVPTDLVNRLKTEDFRDRGELLAMQPALDAAALAMGPGGILTEAPIVSRVIHAFEPTKIKEFRVELHQFELRKFQFTRQAQPGEKAPAKEKDKDKKPAEPPSVRDQVWLDQSGLIDFSLNSKKVNELAEAFSQLQAERIVTLVDGPKGEYKLDAKDAVLKIDATLESGQVVTLTVGAKFAAQGAYFAHSSAMPKTVFLLPANWADRYLEGAAYFGKDRLARD